MCDFKDWDEIEDEEWNLDNEEESYCPYNDELEEDEEDFS
jgi:hypothetical protein